MNWLDILLIVLVAAALGLCIAVIIRSRKKGRGCCGNCSGCRKNCSFQENGKEAKPSPTEQFVYNHSGRNRHGKAE